MYLWICICFTYVSLLSFTQFSIVDNFNVKKRLKFKHYLYICTFDINILYIL